MRKGIYAFCCILAEPNRAHLWDIRNVLIRNDKLMFSVVGKNHCGYIKVVYDNETDKFTVSYFDKHCKWDIAALEVTDEKLFETIDILVEDQTRIYS